jgi:hypothetical protein
MVFVVRAPYNKLSFYLLNNWPCAAILARLAKDSWLNR